MSMQNLQIAQVEIGKLKPYPKNPRHWSEKARRDLTESIKRFGCPEPLIVNSASGRENLVIGGNFRLSILKELGYKEAPVVFVKIDDIKKEQELNLRLNRNVGEFSMDLLKEFNIDLLLDVGFDESELTAAWDDTLSLADDEFDTEKELAKITKPTTKIGDFFQLGRHYLTCNDSTDPTVVAKLMGKQKVDVVYSDPPFNIGYDYQKGLGKKVKYDCEAVKDNRTRQEYGNFLNKAIQNAIKVCKKDAHIFFYSDQNYVGLLQSLYTQNGITNRRTCLWIKNNSNPTSQVAFNKMYEPCIYGTRGKPYLADKQTSFAEILNPEIENGNRGIEDILDMLDIWLIRRISTQNYTHPTEKPVMLHERPLKRCSKPGDKVLDLFAGSGSTLIACEQMARTAFVVEKNPAFCDLIIKRFKATNPSIDVKKLN